MDLVATRSDSIGKHAALASLGYTGGVNESIYEPVCTSDVEVAAMI